MSYITVTCHFINNFKLKSAVLSTQPLVDQTNHNSENIATTLRLICDEWAIFDKVQMIVTDNAASMIKACDIKKKKKHLPCFAHTLNVVMQDVMAENNVKPILNIVKRIVAFVKSSAIANAKFKNAQATETPLKLVQEVPTRWNSSYYMLQRVLRTREPLIETFKISKCADSLIGGPVPHY